MVSPLGPAPDVLTSHLSAAETCYPGVSTVARPGVWRRKYPPVPSFRDAAEQIAKNGGGGYPAPDIVNSNNSRDSPLRKIEGFLIPYLILSHITI